MGETAKALGQGRTFTYKNRSLEVTPRNLAMIGLFEVWLEGRARDKIIAHSAKGTPQEYAEALSRWEDKCATGHYSWSGPVCWEARFHTPGLKYMAYLQLAFKNPEIDESFIDEIATDATKIGPEPQKGNLDKRQTKWEELLAFVVGPLDPNQGSPSTPGA
jgi:hypothetical protein